MGFPHGRPAAHRLRHTTKVEFVGATEVGGVPIPPEGRVWRHPSEVGQARRLMRRHERRRAMLVAAAWAALLVAAVTVGYGAVTD